MRYFIIMQGPPASGKSTFLQLNKLEPYVVCPDLIRQQFASPILLENGEFSQDLTNDRRVWDIVYDAIETRMKRGDLIIIDATHTNKRLVNRYKKMVSDYRYRAFYVDMTPELKVIHYQNKMRQSKSKTKFISEEVINRKYQEVQELKLGNWIKKIEKKELRDLLKYNTQDFNSYEKIVHFGDIHGCMNPVNEYFENNPINDNYLYVFVGDYVDRGLQNFEAIKFVLENKDRSNFIFLEGNHERHLNDWGNDNPIVSKTFEKKTLPEILPKLIEEFGSEEKAKKKMRQLYRKLRQMVVYEYDNKKIYVTHGGISKAASPEELIRMASRQFIHGVGYYGHPIDESFFQNSENNEFQIHGHRNPEDLDVRTNVRTFNLEGGIEFGDFLRIVELDKEGFKTVEIENKFYDVHLKRKHFGNKELTDDNFLEQLQKNPNVIEKELPNNIHSFNFSRGVFCKRLWDKQTVKARGLFVNMNTGKIVARSYNKFFNMNERPETTKENLKAGFKYPVEAYEKENGFLGILGFDTESNDFVVASKSTTQGEFAANFKRILEKSVDMDKLFKFMKNGQFSMVFEVIDPVNDPHIVKYDCEKIVLLDIIYNKIDFKRLDFRHTQGIAKKFGLEVKKLIGVINDGEQFEMFLNAQEHEQHEGFVFEDASQFQVKVKIDYYNLWKKLRGCVAKYLKKGKYGKGLLPEEGQRFMEFIETLPNDEIEGKDIISLRELFHKSIDNSN